MINNKIKKIILMMLTSGFVSLNSFSVSAKDEFIDNAFDRFTKIKKGFENFISGVGNKFYGFDDKKFEQIYENFKKIKSMIDTHQEIKQKEIKKNEELKKLFDDVKSKAKKNSENKKAVNSSKQGKTGRAQRIVEITDFLKSFEYDKNFDKTKYMVEGYNVYPFTKGNVTLLYYVHEKTNFQTIVSLKEQQFTSLFFSCPPFNDKGGTHVLEHLLSSPIFQKLANKLGYISHRFFNAQTIEDGFYYLIHNSILDLDVLIWILQELIDPAFLNDRDYFNAEVKRAYHEMENNKVSKKYDGWSSLKFLNKYRNGGVPEEILKNTHDDIVELWKKYVRPNNMLLILSVGDKPEKIKKFLKTIDEEYLQKANNEPVNTQYQLKATEKYVKLSKDSTIFKNVQDWDGNSREDINYIGTVCFNVENLSLEEKDALNLCANALESFSGFSEKIKAKGYEFSYYDGSESLNGEVTIRLYGRNKDKFSKSSLIFNVKDILREISSFLSSIRRKYINAEDSLMELNPLTNKKYIESGNFNRPNKYRKEYSIYNLFFNSKTKYKTPLSNNIFTIRNGEMIDSKEEVEKNMMVNIETILKTLSDQPVKYMNVVEKSDEVKEPPREDLLKRTNYKIKGCDGDNNLFRFIEFIIKAKANNKVESLGLAYKGLLKAPYLDGNLMCVTHKQSKEDIDNYLNGDFKNVMQKYDLNKLEFFSKIKSYEEVLSREIKRAAGLKEMLEAYYKDIYDCIQNNKILCGKYSLFLKLKDNLQDLNVIFDTKEEFSSYRKKIKEFEKGFDYHFTHQKNNKGGKEDKFLEFLIDYVNFNIKTVVTVHNNLVKLHNNINSISYEAAKNAIEMNK